jgi:hypothetical protein
VESRRQRAADLRASIAPRARAALSEPLADILRDVRQQRPAQAAYDHPIWWAAVYLTGV